MRPRLRTESGPRTTRDGRPLELVRVRGTQRNSGLEGRDVKNRPRRRGGRGRSRSPRSTPPPRRPSLWAWIKALFAPAPAVTTAPAPRGSVALGEQEARAIAEFCKHFELTFNDPGLLKLALTHRSYLSVTGQGPRESNERLEFLGDSVLGLVTSEYLYRQYPGEHEGQLTKTKSLLVSKAILSRRALAMGLGRFVLMSHSEVESGGRQRLSIIADAFESVTGAIYLDQGFEAARDFIERWLLRDSREIAADKRHTNYKSHLQEYVQSTFRTHPVYRIRHEVGPDHSKQFVVEVMVGKRTLGEGKGRNKKEAEQAAARDALESVQGRVTEDHEVTPRPQERLAEREEIRRPRERVVEREEVRGPRERVEAPPAAPLGAAEVEEAEESPQDQEFRRRSRRGRRGGRGRVGPAEPAPQGERPATREERSVPREERSAPEAARAPVARPEPRLEERPVIEAPASPRIVAPSRVSREPRRVDPERPDLSRHSELRIGYEPEPRLPEIEPLPPAHEEDDNEEVGRPEGPLEERHIDPFAVEPDDEPADFDVGESERAEEEWSPELASSEDEPEPTWLRESSLAPAEDEPEPYRPRAESPPLPQASEARPSRPREALPPEPEAAEEPTAPPGDTPRFGRRQTRNRRSR